MTTSALPHLVTSRLIVRPAVAEDAPAVLAYFQENRDYLAPSHPLWPDDYFTLEYWEERIRRNREELHRDESLRMFLFPRKSPGIVMGTVNFTSITRGPLQSCYLGYGLAEASQGQNYMFEALRAAIPYVFDELHIHRIMANYMPHNQRSGILLRRLGFAVEGYARDYLLLNGRWEDHILTSLTNQDWTVKPAG